MKDRNWTNLLPAFRSFLNAFSKFARNEWVTSWKPPFSFVGVDCFGPFSVKRGRSQVKRYSVLHTCLVTRAVHIEVAYSMDTDSFINSISHGEELRSWCDQIMARTTSVATKNLVPPSLNGMCSKFTDACCRGISSGSLILLQALTKGDSGSVASGRL